jgi:putative transposase
VKTGRPRAPIVLTTAQRQTLEAWQDSSGGHGTSGLTDEEREIVARRASIVLASASGEANNAIARRMKVAIRVVQKWRTRFRHLGPRGSQPTVDRLLRKARRES